jgi:hypothetical protein
MMQARLRWSVILSWVTLAFGIVTLISTRPTALDTYYWIGYTVLAGLNVWVTARAMQAHRENSE